MENKTLSKNEILEILTNHFKFKENELKCVYIFGGRLYRTSKPNSDYDILLVIEDGVGPLAPDSTFKGCPEKGSSNLTVEKIGEQKNLDFVIYSISAWKNLLLNHDIRALICHTSLPEDCIIKSDSFDQLMPRFQNMILKHQVYRFTHGIYL